MPGYEIRFLDAGGVSLAWAAIGEGPGLLVPSCNFPWLDTAYVAALAAQFTVVVASPRGYGRSTRLSNDQYGSEMLATDLLAVTAAAGFERFSVLGYSLTAAIGSWLAVETGLVDAVVAGGFPLLGSYGRLLEDVEAKVASEDAGSRQSAADDFDPGAVLAFYRHLASLPDGALVDRLACPAMSFWGSSDEVIGSFGVGLSDLEIGLSARDIGSAVLPDLDHLGVLLRLDEVLPEVCAWLLHAIP